jgi:molecular chaperone GrpE
MTRHKKEESSKFAEEQILRPENELPEKEPVAELPEKTETETLKKQLAEKEAEADANLAGWQRAQADFINYKRRIEADKEDTIKYANNEFIRRILPILDDFERAFASIPSDQASVKILDGMRLVERKFRNFLEFQGVTEINALNQPFDPNLHEAVMQAEGEEGIVVKEFEKGYKINDRVIRPSKVVVGTGKTDNKEE